jgi:hypothetical protein
MTETTTGDGWAVRSIDGMGEGPGFRKVRRELDVKGFGVNAVVMTPGYLCVGAAEGYVGRDGRTVGDEAPR